MAGIRVGTSCPRCDTPLRVDPGLVGKAVRCSTCRHEFVVSRVIFSDQISSQSAHAAVEACDTVERFAPCEPAATAAPASEVPPTDINDFAALAAKPSPNSCGGKRRFVWLRQLAINFAFTGIMLLVVWLVRESLTNYAVVRWTIDKSLRNDSFQVLVDGQPIETTNAVIEQRLRPGRHTLAIHKHGRELQHRKFTVEARVILTYHVHGEDAKQ